jgi:uncharacterized RmlC-like cupin family protein
MSSPKITNLDFTYKKPDADVWVLNTDDIPVHKEAIKDSQIVHLGTQSVGGNHKHSRTEWFVGFGNLVFVWLDEKGDKHEEPMHAEGQLRLIEVPPFLPHAVVNRSHDKVGILYEMADEKKMKESEKVEVV